MEEKERTDEEVIKALECKVGGCMICESVNAGCPYDMRSYCDHEKHLKDILDMIHRLQDENAEYERTLDDGELVSKEWHDEQVLHLQEENERLTEELEIEKHNHKATQWHFDNSYKEGVRLLEANKELRKQVKEYQDKIEQGTLIELPCKVGDTVWVVCGDISQYKITEFWYDGVFFNFRGENNEYVEEHKRFRFFDERIGKTVFLTREEAEKRLKELQNG